MTIAMRIALAEAINPATYYRYVEMMDDVLASPEMQEAKRFLRLHRDELSDVLREWVDS